MEEIARILMLWIAANSPYDTSAMSVPRIIVMSPVELTSEAYRDMPHLKPPDDVDERVLALYSFNEGPVGTIYVLAPDSVEAAMSPDERPEDDPIFRERLLHELVHHAQRLSGAYDRFPCRNFGEFEAYQLGGRYLKQLQIEDPLPNRNFWAHIYSRC